MALDIHLGSSKLQAEELYPSLSFDESLHDSIFSDNNKWIKDYPKFMKMTDYYSDATFKNEDIEFLKSEMQEILCKITDEKSGAFLKEFIRICDLAIERKENIYCFCD